MSVVFLKRTAQTRNFRGQGQMPTGFSNFKISGAELNYFRGEKM